jgi:hypothetical protein
MNEPTELDSKNNPVFIQKVVQMPGMDVGKLGNAGEEKTGPTIQVVAVPMWSLILERSLLYHYVNGLLTVAGLDGMAKAIGEVGGIQIVPPADFLTHVGFIVIGAVLPGVVGALRDLDNYLRKRRIAAGLAV